MQCPVCKETLLKVKANNQILWEHFDINRKFKKSKRKCSALKDYFDGYGRTIYIK